MCRKVGMTLLLMLCGSGNTLAQVPVRVEAGGVIAGHVEGEDGKPLPGAVVSVLRALVSDVLRPSPPVRSVVTDDSGSYQLTGVVAGSYVLCAQLPGSEWLDPCEWDAVRKVVTVTSSQVVRGAVIRLSRGAIVKVRVDDAGDTLTRTQKDRGFVLLAGYQVENGPFISKSANQRDKRFVEYKFAVPLDREVKVGLRARGLVLQDAGGRALAQSHDVEMTPRRTNAAGSNDVSFQIRQAP